MTPDSIDRQLASLPIFGSISVTIKDGQYTFNALRRPVGPPLRVPMVEVKASSFEEGARQLIAAFGAK
jgi:hypothetical protein